MKEGVLVSEGVARDGVTSGTRRRSMRGEQLKIQEAEKQQCPPISRNKKIIRGLDEMIRDEAWKWRVSLRYIWSWHLVARVLVRIDTTRHVSR